MLISDADYMLMLADGTSLAFLYDNGQGVYRFRVDIDGPNKGKNQSGNDIFDFTIPFEQNGNEDQVGSLMPSRLHSAWTGNVGSGYTTAWVIQNGNLDYLKCPNDLNWETKTSCK